MNYKEICDDVLRRVLKTIKLHLKYRDISVSKECYENALSNMQDIYSAIEDNDIDELVHLDDLQDSAVANFKDYIDIEYSKILAYAIKYDLREDIIPELDTLIKQEFNRVVNFEDFFPISTKYDQDNMY